ncbi:FUSC family protein [Neisseria perflava]|uniref:FUSC family protein n=1 Tax=Neisseria perflava TaxID=33053 RepID=UPI0020A176FE|nr:putative membrane protein YccC [Neisseria perflava]
MCAVIFSFVAAKSIGIANDYWAPMTALIIVRPAGRVTYTRMINRLLGTLLGCGVATVIIYLCHDNQYILLGSLIISSALAFSIQKAHYLLLSSLISSNIVFLIAIGFGDPIVTTEHRLIATSLGGLVALASVKLFRL